MIKILLCDQSRNEGKTLRFLRCHDIIAQLVPIWEAHFGIFSKMPLSFLQNAFRTVNERYLFILFLPRVHRLNKWLGL